VLALGCRCSGFAVAPAATAGAKLDHNYNVFTPIITTLADYKAQEEIAIGSSVASSHAPANVNPTLCTRRCGFEDRLVTVVGAGTAGEELEV
jgi:hypothetical protein